MPVNARKRSEEERDSLNKKANFHPRPFVPFPEMLSEGEEKSAFAAKPPRGMKKRRKITELERTLFGKKETDWQIIHIAERSNWETDS